MQADLTQCIQQLQQSTEYQILKRLKPCDAFGENTDGLTLHKVCVIDTETTGLDTELCEIIELGYQIIEFDSQGNFYRVLTAKNFLNEPDGDISAEVTQVTGLTFEEVKDHQIPWQEVEQDLQDCKLCVAHNAGFDRPVLERYNSVFVDKIWGCSVIQIDWPGLTGVGSRSQEFLAWKVGQFFYDAHRALDDVQALCELLSKSVGEAHKTAFSYLLQSVRMSKVFVKATGAPFDVKDDLKNRGYRWNASERVWQKMLNESDLEEEQIWLAAHSTPKPTIKQLKANDSFSVRAQ